MSKKHQQKKSDARASQGDQAPAAKQGEGKQQTEAGAQPAEGPQEAGSKETLRLAPRTPLPGQGLPGTMGAGKSSKPSAAVTGAAAPTKEGAPKGSKEAAAPQDPQGQKGPQPKDQTEGSGAKEPSASEDKAGAAQQRGQLPRTPVTPIPVAPRSAAPKPAAEAGARGTLAQRAAAEVAAAGESDDGGSAESGKGGREAMQDEPVGTGGGFRSLGVLGVLGGCGLAAGAFASPELAGMVDRVGVQPGSVVVAGLVLFGVGVIQRALGRHRQAEKQLFDSLAGANKRLRRDFHELREVSASLGQNVDVLQEKTESLVQLASGHGFQSSIFSLAASLDHLGITVKERCDALDRSVATETGKALESQEALTKRMGELQEGLVERQRELQTSLEDLVGRADESALRLETGVMQTNQQVLEELAHQRGGLNEVLAGLHGELQRSNGAAVAGLRAQIDEVGRALEAGRREGQTQVTKSLERQQASLASSLTGLAEEVHRATRSAGEELLASVEALRDSLEADRRGGEERVGAELARHREQLVEQLAALSTELRRAAGESSAEHALQTARVEALESTLTERQRELESGLGERHESLESTLERNHRTLFEELGSLAARTDDSVAGAGQRVEGELRTVEQRLARTLEQQHAELSGLGRETGELVREGAAAAHQAGEAAREALAMAREGFEAARGSQQAALEALAAAREGTEAALEAGAAAREGSEAAHEASATARGCMEAAREASEAAREGCAGVEQVTPRLERALRERLVDLTREQGALAAGTREAFEGTREAVEARVARLEGWLAEQHGSLQAALESRLEQGQAASGQLGERMERDLRGVEQRLGEDLERRQALVSSELATLSLDVQHAAQDACAKLEGFREQVSGELGQQVARMVEQLREHGAQLESRLEGLGGDGARHEELHARLGTELLQHLEGFRAELLAARPEGVGTDEVEAVLERLAGRIEAEMQARTEKLVGELMAAAELNEERTLTLIGLLSGRELEGLESSAGTGASMQSAQRDVPPALPAEGDGLGASTEVDWAAGTEQAERRWDGSGDAGW